MSIKNLTKRQREILTLKANGNTDQQIAHWLGIKKGTVADTLGRAYRTLGVVNVVQAVAVSIALGEIGIQEVDIPDEQRDRAA